MRLNLRLTKKQYRLAMQNRTIHDGIAARAGSSNSCQLLPVRRA